jgi:hypothetical protein
MALNISQRKRSKAPLFLADLSGEDTKEQSRENKTDSSRFLTGSNDQRKEKRNEEEHFSLDYSLFDIIPTPSDKSNNMTSPSSGSKPATSTPPDSKYHHQSAPAQKELYGPHPIGDQGFLRPPSSMNIFPMAPSLTTTTFPSIHENFKPLSNLLAAQPDAPQITDTKMDETGVPDNDWAELEAWLLSDSVIIMD